MKKGFSIIEAVVVVALFSLLFGLVFEILTTGSRSGDIISTLQDVQLQAKQGMEKMLMELYESNAGKLMPTPPFTNSANLVFQVPVGYDQFGGLLWGAEQGEAIKYQVNSQNQLLRQVLNSYPSGDVVNERVLANYVKTVGFSLALGSSNLTISITTQKDTVAVGTLPEYTLSSGVTFQN